MKKSLLALAAALALPVLPTVAHADLAFNAGVVSDYRYRGISQTRLKPAVQGGIDFTEGGFYAGAWMSTVKWIKDALPESSNKIELDLYLGYKGEISKGLGYDVGLLAYQYPGHKAEVSPNTTEIYGALTFGPATLKYSHSTTNLFGFGDSKGSGYFDLNATFEVASGITVVPHLGYQKVAKNGEFSYLDYSVTLNYEAMKGLVLSAALVGADTKKIDGIAAYSSPANGKDLGKAGLVLGLKYSF